MFWRKKESTVGIVVQPTPSSRVEVEVAKDANKEAKQTAEAVNQHVKELLVENGFTLKIVLAAHNPAARKEQGII
jgi:hypothetical protein